MRKAGKHPRFRGWPRRKVEASFHNEQGEEVTKKLPNLWIGGDRQLGGDWLTFQTGRETKAVKERLCVVCGEPMEGLVVLGAMSPKRGDRVTDGPGGHPRCISVAVATCPHFNRSPFGSKRPGTKVAFVYDGTESGHVFFKDSFQEGDTGQCDVHPSAKVLTLAALQKLAREKPLG